MCPTGQVHLHPVFGFICSEGSGFRAIRADCLLLLLLLLLLSSVSLYETKCLRLNGTLHCLRSRKDYQPVELACPLLDNRGNLKRKTNIFKRPFLLITGLLKMLMFYYFTYNTNGFLIFKVNKHLQYLWLNSTLLSP